jgi:signal transduction histidine kinase
MYVNPDFDPPDERDHRPHRGHPDSHRGDHNRRQAAGTGMGFAIARDILRMHGSELQVKSVPDQGSEFLLSIPAAAPGENA